MNLSVCIIHTSRGGLVDQEALVEALQVTILDIIIKSALKPQFHSKGSVSLAFCHLNYQ